MNRGGQSFAFISLGEGAGQNPYVTGDMNGDGSIDLVRFGDVLGLSLVENLGAGRFAAAIDLPAMDQTSGLATGDFDGDRREPVGPPRGLRPLQVMRLA